MPVKEVPVSFPKVVRAFNLLNTTKVVSMVLIGLAAILLLGHGVRVSNSINSKDRGILREVMTEASITLLETRLSNIGNEGRFPRQCHFPLTILFLFCFLPVYHL